MTNANPSRSTPSSNIIQRLYPGILVWYALVILALSGALLLVLAWSIEDLLLREARTETELFAKVLAAEFNQDLMHHPVSSWDEAYHEFDRLYQEYAALMHALALKVYDENGYILYDSQAPERVGQQDQAELPKIQRALAEQKTVVRLRPLRPNEPLTRATSARRVLEAYVPLPERFRPFAVFEIYIDATPYLDASRQLQVRVATTLLLGMLVLYGSLVLITRRAHLTLDEKVRALEEAHQALVRLQAHKANLLRMVVHDMRNLLGAILGYAELLTTPEATADARERHRWLQSIRQAAQQLVAMVENIGDIGRLEEHRFPVDLRTVALHEVIPEVLASLGCTGSDARCRVLLDADHALVRADETLLRRVVQNLVGNALKYADQGAIWVRARAAEPGWVVLEVEDQGPGIPREHLPHIFEPFYRVPGSSGPGTGLGLAFVKLAVEEMGGRVEVVSEPGQGTTFRVWLPESSNETNSV
ncbi:MAG: hypothetical protein GXO54_01310 [Chloroflexi bacterium]|nr:hypothetical protein [Chloroflexota bacterium]